MSRAKSTRIQHARAPELKLKIRILDDTVGPGKIRILALIEQTGSISAAAREMGIGYRRARFLLDSLQQNFASGLVETGRGSGENSGARLTPLGRDMLARYLGFQQDTAKLAKPYLDWLEQQIKPADTP